MFILHAVKMCELLRFRWAFHFSGNCVPAVNKVRELSSRAFPLTLSTECTKENSVYKITESQNRITTQSLCCRFFTAKVQKSFFLVHYVLNILATV